MGHVTLITPLLGVVCHLKAKTSYSLCVCKSWRFWLQPFQRYHWGRKI